MDKTLRNSLHKLQEIDNFSGIVKIAGDYSVIVLAICLSYLNPCFYPISLLLIGSRLRALENLTHEASHQQLFQNHAANDWIASIFCAFPTQVSLWQYRKAHKEHHLHLGEPERDPDLVKYGYLPLPRKQLTKHLFSIFSGLYDLKSNLVSFFQCFIQPGSKIELLARLGWWSVCLTLVTITHCWWGFFLFYVVPFLITYRIVRQLVDMSEHILDPSVPHPTRNVLCHPAMLFLIYPHGDFLHLTHHLYPAIPGSALPKAHSLLLTDPDYAKIPPFKSYFMGKDSVLSSAFSVTNP
jgi:fatty acid desaturase